MDNQMQGLLYDLGQKIVDYLPNLLAGLTLIGIGWIIGWLAKRVAIQLCVLLRVGRVIRRFRWGRDFAKADVRFGFYNSIGNIAFIVVFLVFLHSALAALRLLVLSDLLQRGVLFFPRLLIALAIVALGWILAATVSGAIYRALRQERIARAKLLARNAKGLVILFFAAMALHELNIAQTIVVIAFATAIVTTGIVTVVLSVLGGKNLAKKVLETLEEAEDERTGSEGG